MKRPTVMFVIGILLGVAVVYTGYLLMGGTLPPPGKVVSEVSSPDRVYLAQTQHQFYSDGHCEARTTVSRDGIYANVETDYVFNTGCTNPVEMRWTGERELLIEFTFDEEGFVRTSRQYHSKDGGVKIEYVLEQ